MDMAWHFKYVHALLWVFNLYKMNPLPVIQTFWYEGTIDGRPIKSLLFFNMFFLEENGIVQLLQTQEP